MKFNSRTFSRYRPRILTLAVLFVVAAMLVLSNLSVDDDGHYGDAWPKSYGWPLIWHRYVAVSWGWDWRTVGWFCSTPRLVANLAIWGVILAVASAACEWLLRRYRPRLRWSLRTMLAAVGLAAALCGWFVAARNRANLQDPIIAKMRGPWGANGVLVTRWGPKWLDLFGADRYRRAIVKCGSVAMGIPSGEQGAAILNRASRLPSLTSLCCRVDRLTPATAAALNDIRQLRRLRIERVRNDNGADEREEWRRNERLPPIGKLVRLEDLTLDGLVLDEESLAGLTKLKSLSFGSNFFNDEDAAVWHECLAVIGKTTRLECLNLSGMKVRGESLAGLAGLTKLESLTLYRVSTDAPSLLGRLPRLPRLEYLDLGHSDVGDCDLPRLAVLPRLKSLDLRWTSVTAAGLAALASLESLEELTLGGDMKSAAGLKSLRAIKGLKKLHLAGGSFGADPQYGPLTLDDGKKLSVLASELDSFQRAVQALRQSQSGLVIDGDSSTICPYRRARNTAFVGLEPPERPNHWLPAMTWLPSKDNPWMTASEKATFDSKGGWARFDAARWEDKTAIFGR